MFCLFRRLLFSLVSFSSLSQSSFPFFASNKTFVTILVLNAFLLSIFFVLYYPLSLKSCSRMPAFARPSGDSRLAKTTDNDRRSGDHDRKTSHPHCQAGTLSSSNLLFHPGHQDRTFKTACGNPSSRICPFTILLLFFLRILRQKIKFLCARLPTI